MKFEMMQKWSPIVQDYDPLKCGSIDGTDTQVHDRALHRAMLSTYHPPKKATGNPHKTIFVGRLNHKTSEATLKQIFSTFGEIEKVSLVRDIVTGFSKGYAFVEYKDTRSMNRAYDDGDKLNIDGNCILVDYEFGRTMKGWKPRRLGGGFGGKKESGQLRFGCRDRPFKRPIVLRKDSNKLSMDTNYSKHSSKRFNPSKDKYK